MSKQWKFYFYWFGFFFFFFFFFSIMLLFVRSFHFQNTQNIIQIISGQNLLTGTQNTGEKWVCYVQSVDFIIFCLFLEIQPKSPYIYNCREERIENSFVRVIVGRRKVCLLMPKSNSWQNIDAKIYEPRHEKTCLWGFRPGKTQTGLLSYRD